MNRTDIETQVAKAFAGDIAEHRMFVKLDQGIYRHLVFQQREHSWNNRFELITAPGSLTITGDRGAHTFRRLTDMFQFFCRNGDTHGINPHYWSEKLPDHGRSVKVYSEDVLRQLIDEHLQEAIRNRDTIQHELDEENERQLEEWREDLRAEGVEQGNPDWPAPTPERAKDWPELVAACKLVEQAQEEIQDYDDDGMLAWEDGARQLLKELERINLVSDTWEWDLSDWDYHFLWCLHAIAWGIRQYDNAVKSGRHVKRTGPVAWDVPLATVAPTIAEPKPERPIKFEVALVSALPTGTAVQA